MISDVILQSAGLFDAPGAGIMLLLARVLFGLVFAFFGLNHFMNADQMTPYAEAKGVPAADIAVPFSGGMLLFGGLGVALGVYPILSAGAIVTFLLVTTPVMHDFWAVPEEDQQEEITNFLKNVTLLGATLFVFAIGSVPWPMAANVGF
jgi:uncharacterized membrane protein YphA (DoxX/SURF4 family)